MHLTSYHLGPPIKSPGWASYDQESSNPPVAPFLVPPPPFARDPLMKLSSASWSVPQAGEHYKGRSISLAGAGAGKSRLAVMRMKSCLSDTAAAAAVSFHLLGPKSSHMALAGYQMGFN